MSLTNHQIEIVVFGLLLLAMLGLAFYGSRWRRPTNPHSLEEWGVGGRAFGNWVTWFLIGGSSYTAYTFVAVPSLVYGVGGFGFYALPFALMTTPLVYVLSTRVWSVCHAHGFVTSAEFARARFGSRTLGLLIGVVGIAATLPYIGVQLIALQAVFKVVGITGEWPLLIALAVISVTTFRSGLRAPALLSIAKDILLVWLLLSAVLVVAMSGGWGSAFHAADRRFANDPSPMSALLLSDAGQVSFLTLAIGSGLSIFAYPHAMIGILSAKDRSTVKRNAAALPAYVLALGVMAMLGVFAISEGVVPIGYDPAHGVIGDLNTIVPQTFHKLFPAWSAGIAYATLAVAALIPAAVMSIASANIFTRVIYVEYFRRRATPAEEARASRWASLFVKFGAAAVVIVLPTQFATDLQSIGGVIVLQMLPAVFLALMTGWFHRGALIAGVLVGLAAGTYMFYQVPQLSSAGKVVRPHWGGTLWPVSNAGLSSHLTVYIGLVAVVLNVLVVVAGTLLLKLFRVPSGRDATRPEDFTADVDDDSLDRLETILDGQPQAAGQHALRYESARR